MVPLHAFLINQSMVKNIGNIIGKFIFIYALIENKTFMKSILIKDTTISERIDIVRESLDYGGGECEGIDMEDMYDDYIYGRKELAEINLEFSRKNGGFVTAGEMRDPIKCMR